MHADAHANHWYNIGLWQPCYSLFLFLLFFVFRLQQWYKNPSVIYKLLNHVSLDCKLFWSHHFQNENNRNFFFQFSYQDPSSVMGGASLMSGNSLRWNFFGDGSLLLSKVPELFPHFFAVFFALRIFLQMFVQNSAVFSALRILLQIFVNKKIVEFVHFVQFDPFVSLG